MLEIRELTKAFQGRPALRQVSFSVEKGRIHGLLGHNGAGKSTTVGIILGMVAADSGDVWIDGVSVTRHRCKALRKVGAIFESPAFYDYLSGWENLRILMGYSGRFDPKAAAATVERVGLSNRIHSKVRTYSHGMRQRLALAQALLPEPELLLLDEPTDGLDPEGIKWFRTFILDLCRDRGTTVLFNSHLLGEVEQMCDRITILQNGRQVYEGPSKGLAEDVIRYQIDVEPHPETANILQRHGGSMDGEGIVHLPASCDPAGVIRGLVEAGVVLRGFLHQPRSLEDLYMEIRQSSQTGNEEP